MRADTYATVDYISANFEDKTFSLQTTDYSLQDSKIGYKWLIDMTDGQTQVELAAFTVEFVGKEDPLRFEPDLGSIVQIYKQVEPSPWIVALPPVVGGKTLPT